MRECIIHGEEIQSWDHFFLKVGSSFEFPEWFGRNLDALYDCLTDLNNAQLTIYRWSALAEVLGDKAATLKQVLLDAGLENPGLMVCILEDADDEI